MKNETLKVYGVCKGGGLLDIVPFFKYFPANHVVPD